MFGMPHGTFIFPDPPAYGWYLSSTATLLYISYSLHNVVAWIKNKPFLSRRLSLVYIGTVIIVQPYWVLEVYANWTYNNNINNLFHYTRPYEALFRYASTPFSRELPFAALTDIYIQRPMVDLHNNKPLLEHQTPLRIRHPPTSPH